MWLLHQNAAARDDEDQKENDQREDDGFHLTVLTAVTTKCVAKIHDEPGHEGSTSFGLLNDQAAPRDNEPQDEDDEKPGEDFLTRLVPVQIAENPYEWVKPCVHGVTSGWGFSPFRAISNLPAIPL